MLSISIVHAERYMPNGLVSKINAIPICAFILVSRQKIQKDFQCTCHFTQT